MDVCGEGCLVPTGGLVWGEENRRQFHQVSRWLLWNQYREAANFMLEILPPYAVNFVPGMTL